MRRPWDGYQHEYHRVSAPGHTGAVFDRFKFDNLLRRAIDQLDAIWKATPGGIQCLVGCGNSGIPLVTALSLQTQIPFATVRKKNDPSYDSRVVTGWLGRGKYLIVDDLISSGRTMHQIVEHVHYDSMGSLKPAGIMLYGTYENRRDTYQISYLSRNLPEHSYRYDVTTLINIRKELEGLEIPVWEFTHL